MYLYQYSPHEIENLFNPSTAGNYLMGARVPGHQCPQLWLNIHCIGTFLKRNNVVWRLTYFRQHFELFLRLSHIWNKCISQLSIGLMISSWQEITTRQILNTSELKRRLTVSFINDTFPVTEIILYEFHSYCWGQSNKIFRSFLFPHLGKCLNGIKRDGKFIANNIIWHNSVNHITLKYVIY